MAQFISKAKELISNKAHFEVMRGTLEQNDEYVSKDGDVTEVRRDQAVKLASSKSSWGSYFTEIMAVRDAHNNEALEEYFPTFVKYPNLEMMFSKVKEIGQVQALIKELDLPLRKLS